MSFYLPMAVIVLSVATYQVAAKLAPPGLNPWHLLTLVYATAGLLTLAVGAFDRETTLAETFRQSNWTVYLIGLAVVGIELGYLLAFRAGWKLSVTGLVSHASVAVLMLPVGLLLFREKLSPVNFAGIALCVVGLVLITRR